MTFYMTANVVSTVEEGSQTFCKLSAGTDLLYLRFLRTIWALHYLRKHHLH